MLWSSYPSYATIKKTYEQKEMQGEMKSLDKQLNLLLEFLCSIVNENVDFNKKLLRDILDVTEGLLRKILTKNDTYSHSCLKGNCSYSSKAVQDLRLRGASAASLLKITHREHAVPVNVLIEMMNELRPATKENMRSLLSNFLISVLITKEEQSAIDHRDLDLRSKMPIGWDRTNAFVRFKDAGIEVVEEIKRE